MQTNSFISMPIRFEQLQIIDTEFERFEINSNLKMQLRETETANFYHHSLNKEE